MTVSKELEAKVRKYYTDRFDVEVKSVQDGADDVFRGRLVVATYLSTPGEKVSDVVFVDRNEIPKIFDTTQELILFLREQARYRWIDAFIDQRLFHALVLVLLLIGVFWAGLTTRQFDARALAILGSVVGLAAGLFFGPSKK